VGANQIETVAAGEHVVQFYEHDCELVSVVLPFLSGALCSGEVAVVIATEAHRVAFEAALEDTGVEVAQARATGLFVALDAATTLSALIRDDEIDRAAFRRVIGGLMRTVGSSECSVRAYGEMVGLLWDAGNVLAAIELEKLWNELARELPFALFCAYAARSALAGHAEALQRVRHLHTAVLDPQPIKAAYGHGTTSADQKLIVSLPADREAPGEARRLLVDALRTRGCEGASVDAAALVLSELASNVVRHVGLPFLVQATLGDSTLRLVVEDPVPPIGDGSMPIRPTHGLGVVDALARQWGIEPAPRGKLVWAELAL
jgi:anti-sigma regulatory factor (Ser/Thr protein kinase)